MTDLLRDVRGTPITTSIYVVLIIKFLYFTQVLNGRNFECCTQYNFTEMSEKQEMHSATIWQQLVSQEEAEYFINFVIRTFILHAYILHTLIIKQTYVSQCIQNTYIQKFKTITTWNTLTICTPCSTYNATTNAFATNQGRRQRDGPGRCIPLSYTYTSNLSIFLNNHRQIFCI